MNMTPKQALVSLFPFFLELFHELRLALDLRVAFSSHFIELLPQIIYRTQFGGLRRPVHHLRRPSLSLYVLFLNFSSMFRIIILLKVGHSLTIESRFCMMDKYIFVNVFVHLSLNVY